MTPIQRKKLRQGRLENYLNQREAADLLNVSVRTYQKWEQGESGPRRIESYIKIAKLFNMSLDWWLDDNSNDSLILSQLVTVAKTLSDEDRKAILEIMLKIG